MALRALPGWTPILKLHFMRGGPDLCAGFYLSSDWAAMERLAAEISTKIARP